MTPTNVLGFVQVYISLDFCIPKRRFKGDILRSQLSFLPFSSEHESPVLGAQPIWDTALSGIDIRACLYDFILLGVCSQPFTILWEAEDELQRPLIVGGTRLGL
jgi:hypothetical protein